VDLTPGQVDLLKALAQHRTGRIAFGAFLVGAHRYDLKDLVALRAARLVTTEISGRGPVVGRYVLTDAGKDLARTLT